MANYCSKCGAKLTPDSLFCPKCGEPVAEAPKTKKTKEKKGHGFLNFLLSLTLIGETAVAGFWYPGFLKNYGIPVPSFEKTLEEEEYPVIINGDTEDIAVSYTAEEIDASPVETIPVTKADPVAVFKDMRVDMKEWNLLQEEDELIIRSLPQKSDEKTGWQLTCWDFSLASENKKFFTNVEITMPVEEDDDLFTSFVWLNEKNSRWEDLYSEISEDGKEYHVYIDHFTKIAKKKGMFNLRKELKQTSSDVDQLLKNIGSSAELFVEYKPSHAENRMNWCVHMDTDMLLQKAQNGTLKPIQGQIDKFYNESISLKEAFNNLNNEHEKTMGELTGYFGASLTMAEGAELIKNEKLLYILNSALTWADFGALVRTLHADAVLNRNPGKADMFKKRWSELISTGLGFAGMLTEGALNTQLGVFALAWWFAGYCQENLEQIDSYNVDLKEPEWRFYEFYLSEDRYINVSAKHAFASDLDGRMLKPPSMDDADYKKFEKDMRKVPGLSGKPKTWVPAFASILKIYEDRPEMVPVIIDELYEKYARSYFDIPKKERTAWQEKANKKLAIDMSKYVSLSHTETDETVKTKIQQMKAKTAQVLMETYKDFSTSRLTGIKSYIRNNIDKVLNAQIVFRVKDESLSDEQTFADSRYAVDFRSIEKNQKYIKAKQFDKVLSPMRFTGVNGPLFVPRVSGGKQGSAKNYYPYKSNFLPKVTEGSDIVFTCTLYHWLMMGCPTAMNFYNVKDENGPALTSNAVHTGETDTSSEYTFTVSPGMDLDAFLGIWHEVNDLGYIGLSYSDGKLGYYENENLNPNKEWIIIESYNIDPKKKTLTLYSDDLLGPVTVTLVDENTITMPSYRYDQVYTFKRE